MSSIMTRNLKNKQNERNITLPEYGFTIKSMEEEERLQHLEGRLTPNVDSDDDALQTLGFYSDIYPSLENLGWRQFSDGVPEHTQTVFVMEMLMTMKPIMNKIYINIGEEVPCLSFRLSRLRENHLLSRH
jgi:hypothetical protein